MSDTLDQACYRLELAKASLAVAQQEVDAAKEEIIYLVGVKPEGSQSASTHYYKITTTGRMNRTLDQKAVHALAGQVFRFPLIRPSDSIGRPTRWLAASTGPAVAGRP